MSIIKKSFTIYLIFIVLSLISLLIFSVIINNKNQLSYNYINTTTLVIGMIQFLILGLSCGMVYKKNGLLNSFIHSSILLFIFFLINYLGFEYIHYTMVYKYFILFLCALIGGIFSVNINFKKVKA